MWSPGGRKEEGGRHVWAKGAFSPLTSKRWIRNQPLGERSVSAQQWGQEDMAVRGARVDGAWGQGRGMTGRGQGLEAAKNSEALWKKDWKGPAHFCHYGWWWRESTYKISYIQRYHGLRLSLNLLACLHLGVYSDIICFVYKSFIFRSFNRLALSS